MFGKEAVHQQSYVCCVEGGVPRGRLGNSVLIYLKMYERLASYLANSAGLLYILKLDLPECFDNIPEDEVIKLMSGLFNRN